MKQTSEQDKNIVGKALYDLIAILNEIDLYDKNTDKDSPDEMIIKRGGNKIKVKL